MAPNTRMGATFGLMLGFAACGGETNTADTADATGAAQTQTGADTGGTGTTEPEPTSGADTGQDTDTGDPPAAVDVPMRRLTRFEYRNTVHDLLANVAVPEVELPIDDRREGFDNNAAALVPTKLHVEQYNGAAEAIAEWSIVIAEQPTAPRFGVNDAPELPEGSSHLPLTPADTDAAHLAVRLRQHPVRVTIPATVLLAEPEEGPIP